MVVAHHVHQPRRLMSGETLEGFSCGVPPIDAWAAERAPSAAQYGTAVVYASFVDDATESDAPQAVAGFYTLSAYSVERSSVAGGWLRRNTLDRIPAILIGMLGVSRQCQGEGLGWQLLQDAIMRPRRISRQLGSRAIIVEPYDDSTRSFYEHFGFRPIPGSNSMYLRLA